MMFPMAKKIVWIILGVAVLAILAGGAMIARRQKEKVTPFTRSSRQIIPSSRSSAEAAGMGLGNGACRGVGSDAGPIKYELVAGSYQTPNGQDWDRQSFVRGLTVKPLNQVYGTVLVEMTGLRSLKFEAFPDKTADQVAGFTSAAVAYSR